MDIGEQDASRPAHSQHPQPQHPLPAQQQRDQLQRYQQQGFVVREALLDTHECARACEQLAALHQRARTDPSFHFDPGSGDGTVERAPCYRAANTDFFVQLEPGLDPEEGRVRKLMSFCPQDPWLAALAERLALVAAELLEGPVLRFQDMALLKPPGGGEKPWHQDCAYFAVLPVAAVIGAWVALDDADVHNGCMHVVPGAHRGGAQRHHIAHDCELVQTPPGEDRQAVEMAAGSVLFFSGMLPHGTPPNRSTRPRRALQFHYRRADSRLVERAEYDRVFVDDRGRPASCAAAGDRS